MTLYMVVDHKGYVRPFTNFEEAKRVFEQIVRACRHMQAYNATFKSRFITVKDGQDTIKQFQSNYQNSKGKWVNEWYSLQTTVIE